MNLTSFSDKLTRVSFSRVHLDGMTMFKRANNLKEIKLQDVHVKNLHAAEFAELDNLTTLIMRNCRLSIQDLNENETPHTFTDGTSAKQWRLNENEFNDTILFTNLLNLEELNLSKNQLTALHPLTFSQMTTLRYLYLGGNKLIELDSNLFNDLCNLEELISLHPHIFSHLDTRVNY